MILQSIISQSNGVAITDITTPELVLLTSETGLPSYYWFTPYRSSDFPTVVCDKEYFFIYSSDHAVGSTGGVSWGKGNNLDLSDFVEIGRIVQGTYQAETPLLKDFPNEVRRLRLYYHTTGANPINDHGQETNLLTSSGGVLSDDIWTQEDNPLGHESGNDHTGYFKYWTKEDGTFKGCHFVVQSSIPVLPIVSYSTISSDGLIGTRDGLYDPTLNAPEDRFYSYSFGEFFKYAGQWWWIGTINSSLAPGETKVLGLAKANSDFEIIEFITFLNGGQETRTWSFRIEANVCHCYLNDKFTGVWYSTYDLLQLTNYL